MTKQTKRLLWLQIIVVLICLVFVIKNSYSVEQVVYSVVVSSLMILSCVLMLKQIKIGFYIICIVSMFFVIYNVIVKKGPLFTNLVAAMLLPVGDYYYVYAKRKIKIVNILMHKMKNTNFSAGKENLGSVITAEGTTKSESKYGFQTDDNTTEDSSYTSQSTQASNSEAKNNQSKADNFSANNPSFFGSSKNMDVTVDLYKELDIDRAWDEKTIRNHLKNLQRTWIQRQGATNDKEQLLIIDNLLKNIENAMRYLTKAAKRQVYDQSLQLAYQNGRIVDVAEEKLHTLLDQAKAYYRKGNIKLATKFAEEAVEGEVNDVSAYDLLARCYFDVNAYDKALSVVDHGTSVFKTDINLHWLGARIATIGTKNFENAQQRVNKLIELAPDNSIGYSEQVYLHLRSGDENLAFQEIDSYIEKHPNDDNFKCKVAYDIDAYSNNCYYYDAAQNATFIADKASYQKCLNLRTKAVEIFEDEHTQNQLENAEYYGRKEWNDWNMPAIKSLATYGTIFTVLGFVSEAFLPFGIALYFIMGILIYFSFRPYWQINKSYVTGQAGMLEKIVSATGNATARMAEVTFRALVQILGLVFKFILGLASGKWF